MSHDIEIVSLTREPRDVMRFLKLITNTNNGTYRNVTSSTLSTIRTLGALFIIWLASRKGVHRPFGLFL